MTDRDALIARLRDALRAVANHCPCGYRPESPDTHPHVGGCPVATACEAADALSTPPPALTTTIGTDPVVLLNGPQHSGDMSVVWPPPADLVALVREWQEAEAGWDGSAATSRRQNDAYDALIHYPLPTPDRSDRNDTRRDCTCLGSCRGPERLGERWKCALGKSPAPDRSDR